MFGVAPPATHELAYGLTLIALVIIGAGNTLLCKEFLITAVLMIIAVTLGVLLIADSHRTIPPSFYSPAKGSGTKQTNSVPVVRG